MKATSARAFATAAAALAAAPAAAAVAIQPGRAAGTATVDGTAATTPDSGTATRENLFDDSKRDTVVVISDRPLGAWRLDFGPHAREESDVATR